RLTAQIFNRGDQSKVDLAVVEQPRAFRRHVAAEAEPRRAIETNYQRAGVQVPDGSQTNRHHEETRSKRPFRSTGSCPAATMLRRISSSGARRRPSLMSSSADTPSTSSAPTVSATCASLGP